MKIVVVGGSGLIGPKLVTMLTGDGHDVVAASRRSGVDIVSGEGSGRSLEWCLGGCRCLEFPFLRRRRGDEVPRTRLSPTRSSRPRSSSSS
jgi:nucleoside-diphosphate-sugar epimerase